MAITPQTTWPTFMPSLMLLRAPQVLDSTFRCFFVLYLDFIVEAAGKRGQLRTAMYMAATQISSLGDRIMK
jgi:hypothetical protein